MNNLAAQIRRDLALMWAGRCDAAVMLAFFLIIITLFPLAIGPDPARLQPVALPVIWIAALLASLAGFPRIFADDVRCGWIDQVALSPLPLPPLCLVEGDHPLACQRVTNADGSTTDGCHAVCGYDKAGTTDAGTWHWHAGIDAAWRAGGRARRRRAQQRRIDGHSGLAAGCADTDFWNIGLFTHQQRPGWQWPGWQRHHDAASVAADGGDSCIAGHRTGGGSCSPCRSGGGILMIRHAVTPPVGDPPDMPASIFATGIFTTGIFATGVFAGPHHMENDV